MALRFTPETNVKVLPADIKEIVLDDVVQGETYNIRVLYEYEDGTYESVSFPHTVVGKASKPSPPTNVTVTAGPESVELTWDNPADVDLDKIHVYFNTHGRAPGFYQEYQRWAYGRQPFGRGPLGGVAIGDQESYLPVKALPGTKGHAVIKGLTPGKTYYFWLVAIDSNNPPVYSDRVGRFEATPITIKTSTIEDDAGLGQTADWSKVVGDGKPEDGATNDAAWRHYGDPTKLDGGVIYNGTIVGDKLAVGTITAKHIASRSITANEIKAETLTANELKAGSIDASRLNVSELSAITADLGTVTAGSIVVGSTNKLWLNDAADGSFAIGGTDKTTAPFRVASDGALTATNATITGTITADSGSIGGWTVGTDSIYKGGLTLDSTNTRIRATSGANYVELSATGLTGYSSTLGTTFSIPVDGSAPTFSSGTIKEATYEIYTNGVIKTAADPATSGGVLINNAGISLYDTTGIRTFYADASTGDVSLTGTVTITGGSGITNLSDAGALAVKDSVDLATTDVVNKVADYIAESATRKWAAESGADVTANNTAADTSTVAGTPAATVADGAAKANAGLSTDGTLTTRV